MAHQCYVLLMIMVSDSWMRENKVYTTRQENGRNQVFFCPSLLPLYLLLFFLLLLFFFLLSSLHFIFHSLFPLLNPLKDKNDLGNSFLLSVTLLFKAYAFYCGIMKRILKIKVSFFSLHYRKITTELDSCYLYLIYS